MDFRIRHLESFLTLASMLNYGRASKVLYITQPALTSQIKALEEVFETKLFDRNSQQVRLTTAGELLVGRARSIIEETKEAYQDMHNIKSQYRLRISCGEVGLASIVPKIIRNIAQTHPNFILQECELDSKEQVSALLDGRVEALLLQENLGIQGAQFEALYEEPLIAAVPRNAPIAVRGTASLADFVGYPVIAPRSSGSCTHPSYVRKLFTDRNLSPHYVISGGSIKSQLNDVEAGRGVTVCPESFKEPRRPGIRFLEINDAIPKLQLGLITKAGPTSTSINIVRLSAMTIISRLPTQRTYVRALVGNKSHFGNSDTNRPNISIFPDSHTEAVSRAKASPTCYNISPFL